MHFVIISVNGEGADLFIGDKSARAQMSCVDTNLHTFVHTLALVCICNASNLHASSSSVLFDSIYRCIIILSCSFAHVIFKAF